MKISRRELEQMDYDTAVNIALLQPEVQKILETRRIKNIKFDIFTGYEGVVNILTGDKIVDASIERSL